MPERGFEVGEVKAEDLKMIITEKSVIKPMPAIAMAKAMRKLSMRLTRTSHARPATPIMAATPPRADAQGR